MKTTRSRLMRGVLLFFSVSFWMIPAEAGAISDRAGTAAVPFLRLDVGPRYVALGGAGTASVDDPYAMYYNVGALTASPARFGVTFQHNEFFQDLTQEYLAGTYRLNDRSVLGLSLNFFDAGDLNRTYESLGGLYGGSGGTFSANDLAFSIGYGYSFTERLSAGVAVKYVRSKIDDVSASTVAGDFGLRYVTPYEGLVIGAAINNVGRGLRYIRERDRLPTVYRAGFSYEFWNERLMLTSDLIKPVDNDLGVGMGLEWRILRRSDDLGLSLRVGYNTLKTDADNGLSLGAGFGISNFALDYAYVPFGDLGNTHRFAGTYRFQ